MQLEAKENAAATTTREEGCPGTGEAGRGAAPDLAEQVRRDREQILREFEAMLARPGEIEALSAAILAALDADRNGSPDGEEDPHRLLIRGFDAEFYRWKNAAVLAPGADPLAHYLERGWREGRDPNSWFSSSHYIEQYPDVVRSGVNPFLHYLRTGRAEGRAAKHPGAAVRAALAQVRTPAEREAECRAPAYTSVPRAEIEQRLADAIRSRPHVVVSVSHDCYPSIIGGTQIFISDEQKRLNGRGFSYIHLSPLVRGWTFRDTPPEQTLTRIVLDGNVLGVATDAQIAAMLGPLTDRAGMRRVLVVHCLIGNSVSGLEAVAAAMRPTQAFFWTHDFSSVCTGFNLLRNDLAYCGAPPMDSPTCRGCVYRASRQLHHQRVQRLFATVPFVVVSPSQGARHLWSATAGLSHERTTVVAHARLAYDRRETDPRPVETIGIGDNAVRVAFVGYPRVPKGWPLFERVVDATRWCPGYRFFHFGQLLSLGVTTGVSRIKALVTPQDRDAMQRALEEQAIDLVVMPATWPETFSYATYEALAAGCDIVTVTGSGNVAATVRETGRGLVLADDEAVVDFFTSHRAVAWVRARAGRPIPRGRLEHCGTTAALLDAAEALQSPGG